jgi:arsenate reductase
MKKAFAWLEGNQIAYRFHDYKKSGVPAELLKRWIKQVGWEALINTKGPTFRNLPGALQQGLTATKAQALMQEFPSLIRRPVLDGGKTLLIGFDTRRYATLLT